MPGVWTHGFVDMWSPGYLAFMSSNHNGLVRMYETFGNGGATTMKRKVEPPEGEASRARTPRARVVPALPPYKEVDWSMRNNTNYMETGVLSALQLTSAFPRIILENFYRRAATPSSRGRRTRRSASSSRRAARPDARGDALVNLLRVQGIEVGAAKDAELKLKDGTFPAGSYVIKRDQPYGRLAKILLEKQDFPDPSLRTYDDTGWTMGLMLQTEVKPIADKAILDVPHGVGAASRVKPRAGHRARAAPGSSSPHHGSNNMVTLRYRLKDCEVRAAEQAFKVGGVESARRLVPHPDGQADATSARVKEAVGSLGLDGASAVAAMPDVAGARRRSAAARDLQHLGQHAGGRLGAARLRPVRACRST